MCMTSKTDTPGLKNYVVLGLLLVLPQIAIGGKTAVVTVKVEVVAPPPCTVNDNRPIEVEFGDVMTTRVDGVNYRMPVNYTLSCDASANNAMKLQVQGTSAFDGQALQTSVAGLGIRLQHGTTTLAVNDWLNFSYPDQPELWATPIMQAGVTLPAGEFTAGASLRVDYQ